MLPKTVVTKDAVKCNFMRDTEKFAVKCNFLREKHYPKYLLTLDNDPVVYHDGVQQIYVLDWLLDSY